MPERGDLDPSLLELDRLTTSRCDLRLATAEDEPRVVPIFAENLDLLRRTGATETPEVYASDVVLNTTLPPGGSVDRARSFLIRENNRPEIVGILAFYVGYPTTRTLYIGTLFLRPAWQRRAFGREVMREVEKRTGGAAIHEIRLGVDPGNWEALRFWVRIGYTHITRISDGGADANPTEPPRLELAKILT